MSLNMQNDTADDPFDFTTMALACAAEAKGADLTDEEVESVLDWVSWYVLALAHGADPNHLAEVMRAESKGRQTVH
jgi:hypothetical protein